MNTPTSLDALNKIIQPVEKYLDAELTKNLERMTTNNKIKGAYKTSKERAAKDVENQQLKRRNIQIDNMQKDMEKKREELEKQIAQAQQIDAQEKEALKQQQNQIKNLQTKIGQTMQEANSIPPAINSRTPAPVPVNNPPQPNQPAPQKKALSVTFDSKTNAPWNVKFTERGFLVGDTRLSFEIIEMAINKNLNLTLNGGSGMVLDAVKMQKILKYKDYQF